MSEKDERDPSTSEDEILTEKERLRLFRTGRVFHSLEISGDAIQTFYHATQHSETDQTYYPPEEVLPDIEKAVKLGADSSGSWVQLGSIFEKTGYHNIALEAYLEAAKLDLNDVQPLLYAYDVAKSEGTARSILLQAKSIDSQHPGVLLRVAEELYADGFKLEALDIFLELAKIDGFKEYARIRIAEIETELLETDGSFEHSRGYDALADWFG
jgi:tetratricopeptide (TPR) repeat protein